IFVAFIAGPMLAQTPDSVRRVAGASISGVVRDSVAKLPLVGAIVQLAAAGNITSFSASAISDSLGRFALNDVPDGRYMLGFLHPMLDSLGMELPLVEVFVTGHRPVRADLGIPSPARLRAAICGNRIVRDSGA